MKRLLMTTNKVISSLKREIKNLKRKAQILGVIARRSVTTSRTVNENGLVVDYAGNLEYQFIHKSILPPNFEKKGRIVRCDTISIERPYEEYIYGYFIRYVEGNSTVLIRMIGTNNTVVISNESFSFLNYDREDELCDGIREKISRWIKTESDYNVRLHRIKFNNMSEDLNEKGIAYAEYRMIWWGRESHFEEEDCSIVDTTLDLVRVEIPYSSKSTKKSITESIANSGYPNSLKWNRVVDERVSQLKNSDFINYMKSLKYSFYSNGYVMTFRKKGADDIRVTDIDKASNTEFSTKSKKHDVRTNGLDSLCYSVYLNEEVAEDEVRAEIIKIAVIRFKKERNEKN